MTRSQRPPRFVVPAWFNRANIARAINGFALAWVIVSGAATMFAFVVVSGAYGIDSQIYVAAARAWLDGGDPWSVAISDIQFAAPPPSLLPFALVADLPVAVVTAAVVGGGIFAVVFAIARTGAPWWWLLSVPVIEGIWVGSLDPIVLAVLVTTASSRGEWLLSGVAGFVRTFAIVPSALLGRRRAVAFAGILFVATAPFLPWTLYLDRFSAITTVLIAQSHGGRGAFGEPWLIAPTIVALIAIGRKDGAWLVAPALWPASQLHYAILAIPVGSPIVAGFAALLVPAPLALGVMALALVRALEGRLDPWSWVPERLRGRIQSALWDRWRPPPRLVS